MNIGLDIDGIFTDLEKFQIEYGTTFFKKKYNMDIVNPYGVSIREIFACTKEQEEEFWAKQAFYFIRPILRIGCIETLNKIKDDAPNVKFFIITARGKTMDKSLIGFIMRCLVKHLLKDVPYENITFCPIDDTTPEAKKEACIKYNIDIMVEDTPENILAIREVSKVVCFDAVYNQNLPDDVMRINYYDELYHIINRLNKNSELKMLTRQEREELSKEALEEYYSRLQAYYAKRIDFNNLRKREKTYEILYPMLKKVFNTKYPYKIIKEENILKSESAIYIANHRDMIDPPLIMSAIGKRPTHLLIKGEFKNSLFAPFLTGIGCFYVIRDNRDSQIISKDEMIKACLADSNLIILPEGTRNKTDKELLPFKLGAVSIARITNKPIVPIGIYKKFDDFGADIILNVGEALNISYTDDIVAKNFELEETVKRLVLEGKEHQLSKRR